MKKECLKYENETSPYFVPAVFRFLKSPVPHFQDLYIRYPRGGEAGWFAFVLDVGRFAYWDATSAEWVLMKGQTPGSDFLETTSDGHQLIKTTKESGKNFYIGRKVGTAESIMVLQADGTVKIGGIGGINNDANNIVMSNSARLLRISGDRSTLLMYQGYHGSLYVGDDTSATGKRLFLRGYEVRLFSPRIEVGYNGGAIVVQRQGSTNYDVRLQGHRNYLGGQNKLTYLLLPQADGNVSRVLTQNNDGKACYMDKATFKTWLSS